MGIIRVSTEELRDGDTIFEDLFADEMNISLIMKGTVVNEKVRNRLKNADIGKILINRVGVEDEITEDIKGFELKDGDRITIGLHNVEDTIYLEYLT